jgi:hypothetical protein
MHLTWVGGATLAYIRDPRGHRWVKMTKNTYEHLLPGTSNAVVDRLDALWMR